MSIHAEEAASHQCAAALKSAGCGNCHGQYFRSGQTAQNVVCACERVRGGSVLLLEYHRHYKKPIQAGNFSLVCLLRAAPCSSLLTPERA